MIDFVKIKILKPDINALRGLPFLEWDTLYKERTGEIKEYRAKFKGLTIVIINNQYAYISGSLHKQWNIEKAGEDQNHNDFTFSSLVWTIEEICRVFHLHAVNCKIENIEIGVNLTPVIPANEILRSIINHKGNPFTQEHAENKYFRECEYQRYIVKIYNKGLQFRQAGNILRFELKYVKMKDLEQYGITTLADITDRGKIKRLVKMLRATFSDLLFYDYTIPETDLPPAERTILTQGQIPAYWNELKKTTPENYYKKRNRFRDLVNRYGKQNIQETIRNLITQKWDDLLKTGPKTLQKLTGDAKGDITEINRSSIGLKPVNLHNPNNTPPGDPPGRFCLGCGKDISHQRQGTKFCTEKFVGEKQAHKCRNIDSNRRNNDKNRIKLKKKKGISFLFDPETLLNMKKKTG